MLQDTTQDQGYSVEEVQARLGLASRQHVHNLTKANRIRLIRSGAAGNGRGCRWDRESVEAARAARLAETEALYIALGGAVKRPRPDAGRPIA